MVMELIKQSEKSYVSCVRIARIYVALGDNDRAFIYLNKAYEDRDIGLPALKTGPYFDPLRDDPRFDALLGKMRLK
jgi:serine/threonine-protein kinase